MSETPVYYIDERIDDELGRSSPHNVFHRKRTSVISDANVQPVYANGGSDYGIVEWPLAYHRDSIESAVGSFSSIPVWDINHQTSIPDHWSIDTSGLDYGLLYADCYEKASQLQADHLLNIVEGNQIWPSIKSVALSLPRLARNWSSFRRVAKSASDSYLAWRFGVKPLISDIKNTVRYAKQMQRDLRRYAEGTPMRFSKAYVAPCSYSRDPDVTSTVINGVAVRKNFYKGYVSKIPTARVVLVVKPAHIYMTKFFQELQLVIDRFGSSPANLAWEILPFSFVVDWFVDVRDMTRTLDGILGHSPFELVSSTKSFSYELTTEVVRTHYTPCDGSVCTSWPASSVTYKHYERSVFSGDVKLRWKPRFGKNQATVSAALVTQALTKLKHN
jgi:hypothetical protein